MNRNVTRLLLHRVKQIHHYQGSSCTRIGRRLTGRHHLIVALQTEGTIAMDDKHFAINPDAFYYCPPDSNFVLALTARAESALFIIEFDTYLIIEDESYPTDSLPHSGPTADRAALLPPETRLYAFDQAIGFCHAMLELRQHSSTFDHLLIQSRFLELLHLIASGQQRPEEEVTDRIERSSDYMQEAYAEQLSIVSLARQANISPKYYMELFRRRFGMGAMQYLSSIRMEAAKRMLARRSGKLKEVARACGYNDEFYFSRRFKLDTGTTPALFMRSRSRNIAVLDSVFLGMLAPLHYFPIAAPMHPVWRTRYEVMFGDHVQVRLSVGRSPGLISDNIKALLETGLRFDVIFCPDWMDKQQLALLERIGRTVVINLEQLPWREPFEQVAACLGAENEINHWLQQYDKRVQYASRKLAVYRSRSLLFLLVEGSRIMIHYDRTAADMLFCELGLQPAVVLPTEIKQPVTAIELAAINPDYLFVLVYQDEETMRTWQQLQTVEDWLELTAVRSNRCKSLASFPWREDSPLSRLLIVEDVLKLITEDCP
ncbi:helix-turn-helix domain-containing protein [Paenibacillaceae bacterium]|nr:helix-turn-helix domain-containing protein [Paenibacillaceae bacterium]